MSETNIRREIAAIAVPVSLEMILQLMFTLIGQVIVGSLGAVAIAAVGLSNSLTNIFVLTIASLGSGAAILTARAHGGGDSRAVSRIVSAALVMAIGIAVLCAIAIGAGAVPLLVMTGAEPNVLGPATSYLRVAVLSLPLVVISAVSSAALRSLGRARAPMVATISTVGLNVGLGYLLVLGAGPIPAVGLLGAAWALVVTQAVRAGVLLALLYRGAEVSWSLPRSLAEWRGTGRELLVLTLPLTLTQFLWSTGTFFYTLLYGRVGTNALAAIQIVNMLEGLFIVASFGLASAATALIGQAVGRGDAQLADSRARTIMRIGSITGAVCGLLYICSALLLPVFYPQVAHEALSIAAGGIVINGLFQVVKVRNMIYGIGLLPSGSDTRGVLIGDAVGAFAVGLPCAVLMAFVLDFGVWGVFWARITEELAKLLVFTWRAGRISWQRLATAEA